MSEHKKTGAERRKHRRFSVVEGMVEPITLELEGADSLMHKQPAIMTDLSAGGISLLMFVEPPHTKSFQMTLNIPGLEGVPIEAGIVASQKGETYSVGLTFRKISRGAKSIEKMAETAPTARPEPARLPEPAAPTARLFAVHRRPSRRARRSRDFDRTGWADA